MSNTQNVRQTDKSLKSVSVISVQVICDAFMISWSNKARPPEAENKTAATETNHAFTQRKQNLNGNWWVGKGVHWGLMEGGR